MSATAERVATVPVHATGALADLSVVVLSYNRRDELMRNLAVLCELQKQTGFELIVVDNCSSDGTGAELRELAQRITSVNFLPLERNYGVAGGRNAGWARATRGYILNLDDDTRVDLDAMLGLYQAALRMPHAGIFTPQVVHALTGECQNGYATDGSVTEPATFHGACHLVRGDVARTVGRIDADCTFGGEELDYSIRARAAGFATVYVPGVTVAHNSIRRTGGEGRERRQRWLYNYARVLFKHFPLSHASVLLTRLTVSHVMSALAAREVALVPLLMAHAVRGAIRGRRQFAPLPRNALTFYESAVLEPDFGNVPFSRKWLRTRSATVSSVQSAGVTAQRCVQFGCGLSTAAGWLNYDASPTLYLQRLPMIGTFFRRALRPRFPANARFGDVLKRLPHADGSADLVYCSHVLEHVCLQDLRVALRETHRILRKGGAFRGVLPDLEAEARRYLDSVAGDACTQFMRTTALGQEARSRGVTGFVREWLGNSRHLWMWDFKGLSAELARAGFTDIRRARYADSEHDAFARVEHPDRWEGCLGFECRK
jgi:GT2 family glycosyltransferase/SAM-dependent methyltransferase